MQTFLKLLLCFFVALPCSAQRFNKIAGNTNELMAMPVPDLHTITVLKGWASSNENIFLPFQYVHASTATPNGQTVFRPTFGTGVGRYHLLSLAFTSGTNLTIINTNVTVITSSNLTFITTNVTFISTNTTNFGFTFIDASTTNFILISDVILANPTNLNAHADTVADLVNLPTSVPFASLGGYAARGDGGGGDFVLTNSVTSTNLGTRIASSTAGYSWDRLYSGPVNVQWFGASTNGVETRGPIQNVLTNGFAEVYFPRGRYVVNGTLTPSSNQTLSGDGDASSISQSGALTSTIAGTNLTGVTVRNLRFVGLADDSFGQPANACNGIYLLTSTNLVVASCTFSNHSSHGVFFNSCKDGLIAENRFDLAGWPSGINKNTVTNNYQIGDIRLANATERITVRGNHQFSEANFGIELNTDVGVGGTCKDNTISGNFLRGHLKYGIILYINTGGVVTKNTVSGNFISDMPGLTAGNDGTYSQTAGIYIQSAEDNLIIGNHLNNIGLFTTGQTVPPGAISANGASSIMIADNRITNSWTRGISIQGAVDPDGVALVSRNYVVGGGRVRISAAISSGSPLLTVSSTNGFIVGNTVIVTGAGIAGANLTTTILSISGVVFTLNANASTTVSGAVVEKSTAWEGGIVVLNRNNVKVTGNMTRNTYQSGLYANFATRFLEFNDNNILSPQGYGIFVSGSVTNSQFNRNVIQATNSTAVGIAIADTNHLCQIKGNTVFGLPLNVGIYTDVGNPLIALNTVQGASIGIQSPSTNIFDNIFDNVTTAYSGASHTSLDRPLHVYSSFYVNGGATNNQLLLNGVSDQLRITPPSESTYASTRINNAAGSRKLELIYIGTGMASVYGIPVGSVGLNAASSSMTLSTSDIERIRIEQGGTVRVIDSSLLLEGTGGSNLQISNKLASGFASTTFFASTGDRRLELVSVGSAHAPIYGIPAGEVGLNAGSSAMTFSTADLSRMVVNLDGTVTIEGFVTNNAQTANSILGTDANKRIKSVALSGLTYDGTTLTASGGAGSVTSVDLSMPALFSVSGNPVTTSGTLTVTATDPGADKLVGWDNTGNLLQYMNIGPGLVYDAATDTLSSTNVGTGGGDFVGPASATDDAIVVFDGATGKLGKNSVGLLSDGGSLTGLSALRVSGKITNDLLTASALMASDADKAHKSVLIGSGLTYNGTTLAASGGAGSVTSVGMTVPAPFSVAGSPITGAGTLAVTATDPAGDRIMGWDDTGNLLQYMIIGAGLTYNEATDTLAATGGGTLFPAGNINEIQFNDGAAAFAASPGLTFNDSVFTPAQYALMIGTTNSPGVLRLGNESTMHNFGTDNMFVGDSAGNFSLSGSRNAGFGDSAFTGLISGSDNTAIGHATLANLTSGSQNVALGTFTGNGNTTGSSNTLVGAGATLSAVTGSSQIVIGAAVTGQGDNTATIGGSGGSASVLNVNAGQAATLRATVGGTIIINTTEDSTSPLMDTPIPADTLARNNERLIIRGGGVLAANGNAKSIAIAFGATTMATISTSANGASWGYSVEVVRTGSSTQEWIITYGSGDSFQKIAYGTAAATLASDVTIQCTGADATQKMLSVEWHPAPP